MKQSSALKRRNRRIDESATRRPATPPTIARTVTSRQNTNAAALTVVTMCATKCRTMPNIPLWLPATIENSTAVITLTPAAVIRRNAPIAASLAATMVRAESGSGPSTIASRRSKASESHITAAMTPIATMEYTMKTVAISRVSGSRSAGNRSTAISNEALIWMGTNRPGVRMKARTPIIACRSCMSEVTDSLAKNCAKNSRQSTQNIADC